MNETKWIISGYSDDLIYVEAIHGDSTEADTQGEIDAYGTTATIETTTGWKFNFTCHVSGSEVELMTTTATISRSPPLVLSSLSKVSATSLAR